jgi:cobalt/nickel transport system permease protein
MTMSLLAVHISDGVLTWPWVLGGFVAAAVLIALGCYRLTDSEVPFLALITAAFFVASLVHIRVGPTSVHLLLNGLAGVLLGLRAGPSIAVGLTLQAVLIGHGGFSSLGVNICVMTIPALFAGVAYRFALHRPIWAHGVSRFALVSTSAFVWCAAALAGVLVLFARSWNELSIDVIHRFAQDWWTWIALVALAALAAVGERRLETDPAFPAGLLLGVVTTVLTVGLNALVLRFVLPGDSEPIAAIVFLAHLPVAAIEGVILGAALGFLTHAAPHLLPLSARGRFVERK